MDLRGECSSFAVSAACSRGQQMLFLRPMPLCLASVALLLRGQDF